MMTQCQHIVSTTAIVPSTVQYMVYTAVPGTVPNISSLPHPQVAVSTVL